MRRLILITEKASEKDAQLAFAVSCRAGDTVCTTLREAIEQARDSEDGARISINGSTQFREHSFRALCDTGIPIELISLIHPTAIISPLASVGDGCIIARQVVINPSAVLGNCVTIGERTVVEHDDHLMAFTTLGPDCALGGNVILGYASTLRQNVTVNHRTSIGQRCLVRAHTAVVGSVPDNSVVCGIPGRVRLRTDQTSSPKQDKTGLSE